MGTFKNKGVASKGTFHLWTHPAVRTTVLAAIGEEDGASPDLLRKPYGQERHVLASFIMRELSMPPHDFLRGLLFYYGIQLHHISSNGMLHIACFINMCECFLGTRPTLYCGTNFLE